MATACGDTGSSTPSTIPATTTGDAATATPIPSSTGANASTDASPSTDSSSTDAAPSTSADDATGTPDDSLYGAYAGDFPIGVAIGQNHLATVEPIITAEFNRITAENAMKMQSIQPTEGNFNFAEADLLADYARGRSIAMTGHTFVWHRQAPAWLFADLTPEDEASIELLRSRLRTHIEAMVERYGDVVDNWDVVNEAISDDASKVYRDAAEGSQWHEVFGGGDYVYWAFQYAYDALEANEPGSAAGKLYYNDYNMTLKIDRVITMLDEVRARGVPVDGIGFQAHWRIGWPSVPEVQDAIQKAVDAGYSVKISELDLTVYADYDATGAFDPAPEVPFTPELEAQQADAYAALFALFRSYGSNISSVTLWGVSDDATWLDHEPVPNRDNYPLLFDDDKQPKQAYFAVRDL